MFLVKYSSAYRKAYKKLSRSGRFPKRELDEVIKTIQWGRILEPQYYDHALAGELLGNRECHVKPDLLLIYRIENNDLVLVLVNIGSHSDLFG